MTVRQEATLRDACRRSRRSLSPSEDDSSRPRAASFIAAKLQRESSNPAHECCAVNRKFQSTTISVILILIAYDEDAGSAALDVLDDLHKKS